MALIFAAIRRVIIIIINFKDYFVFNDILLKFISREYLKLSMIQFIIIIIYSLRVFHISFSWWSFTGVWVTSSLLKTPRLFSVFWLFSEML